MELVQSRVKVEAPDGFFDETFEGREEEITLVFSKSDTPATLTNRKHLSWKNKGIAMTDEGAKGSICDLVTAVSDEQGY